MKEIAACFKKYFDFKGTSSRREYSCFLVFKMLVDFASVSTAKCLDYDSVEIPLIIYLLFLIIWLLQIATIVPFIAATVRRLHDSGHSGWWALILLFPCVSLVFKIVLAFMKGVRAKSEGDQCEVSQDEVEDKPTSCLIWIIVLMVLGFCLVPVLISIGIGAQGPIKEKVSQLQRNAMLRDLYVYLQTYQEDFGSFPSVQPEETRYKVGGGVRDLYPLAYVGRMGEKELNELMQPPGGEFKRFSAKFSPAEFDKNHIGWSYNSRARIGSDEPLMADQGVESGYLRLDSNDPGVMPLSTKGVVVLLANGQVIYVSANPRSGKLMTDQVKDWSVLKD